jgi:hypothetical protein
MGRVLWACAAPARRAAAPAPERGRFLGAVARALVLVMVSRNKAEGLRRQYLNVPSPLVYLAKGNTSSF